MSIHSVSSLISYLMAFSSWRLVGFSKNFGLTAQKLSWNSWQRTCDSSYLLHALCQQQQQPFNGLFSRTTWVSRYQKGKTNLDWNGARDDGVLGCIMSRDEKFLDEALHIHEQQQNIKTLNACRCNSACIYIDHRQPRWMAMFLENRKTSGIAIEVA